MKLIGLDIGTTTICGVLYDSDTCTMLESIRVPNDSRIETENSWERIQDPRKICDSVENVLSQLTAICPNPQGIGVTGQMHGVLYVNHVGQCISPLYTWQDKRGHLPFESQTYSRVLSELLGDSLSPGYGLVTHFYNTVNKIVPREAVALCTIADYIVMRLTSTAQPVTDATNAAGIGGFNLVKHSFDKKALDSAYIDTGILPEIIESGTCVGYWRGVPVFTALGDNQASFLGAVKSLDSSVLVNVGTGGQISVFSGQFVKLRPELELRPFPGGGFLLVGASMSGGKSYAVLERFFRKVCTLFADSNLPSLYEKMEEILNTTTFHSEKLIVDPQFNGTRTNPELYGSISNITTENFTPEDLMIGLLEGISKELYSLYSMLPESRKSKITTLVGSGNGIRKSAPLRHALEGQFDMDLQIPTSDETAAFGAALSAGVGLGIYSDYSKVGTTVEYAPRH